MARSPGDAEAAVAGLIVISWENCKMSPIVLAAPFCWSLPGVLVPFKSKSGGLELSERLLQNNTTYSSCNLKRPDSFLFQFVCFRTIRTVLNFTKLLWQWRGSKLFHTDLKFSHIKLFNFPAALFGVSRRFESYVFRNSLCLIWSALPIIHSTDK